MFTLFPRHTLRYFYSYALVAYVNGIQYGFSTQYTASTDKIKVDSIFLIISLYLKPLNSSLLFTVTVVQGRGWVQDHNLVFVLNQSCAQSSRESPPKALGSILEDLGRWPFPPPLLLPVHLADLSQTVFIYWTLRLAHFQKL